MKVLIAFIVGLIVTPLVFGLVAITGHMPSDASAQPSHWEVSLGMRSLDASLEKRSDGLNNPVKANDHAAIAAGQQIYAHNCASCHGSAKGESASSSAFYPRVPQFFQEGTDVDPNEAYAAVHDGIRYSGMPAWHGQFADRQIWQVATFVAQIRGPGGKTMDMDAD